MNARILWIGVRPERRMPLVSRTVVYASTEDGLSGDHDTKAHRQVTLISHEEMSDAAAKLGRPMDPEKTRRNILVSGMDFNVETGTQVRLGEALVEITGPCLPCSRMDEAFGDGGRLAMARAGGLTARILESGRIAVGDGVSVASQISVNAEQERDTV